MPRCFPIWTGWRGHWRTSWNSTGRTIRTHGPRRILMQTVFLCHAKEDHELSRELTEFLERGAGFQVFLQDGEIAEDENIVSKAVDGLQAEVILLVLSPCSVPERWVRAEWEPALFDEPKRAGVKVGTILAGQCEFPPLLRRAAFFDATQDRLGAFREIK